MHPRLDFQKAAPDALKAVMQLETYVQNSGLERRFIHLIKLRASQINGCAYCVDMHVKESRHGRAERAMDQSDEPVWREAGVYDARERAALGWVEAVTNVAQTGIPDGEFEALKAHFTDAEIMNITVAIGTINTWNRLAVGFRTPHPLDQPAAAA